MTALIDRYPGVGGTRLDTGEDDGASGPAVDLHGRLPRKGVKAETDLTLWVRESGTGPGHSARVKLDADDLRALRDGATRLLVAAGYEREVKVAVPT